MSDDVVLDGESGSNDFDAGFTGTPTAMPPESAEAGQAAPEQQEQGQEQVIAPKYRQITDEEYGKLSAAAAAVEEMRATVGKQIDTAFGKVGGLERAFRELQDKTPAGNAIEVTADDFAELSEEYPELADLQLKALQRVVGRMRGTGMNENSIQPYLDKATPAIVDNIRSELSTQIAKETLAETHPDWEVVIGNSLENKPASKEFLDWFSGQPKEYQARLNASMNPVVIGRAIDKFRDHQASLKKADERKDRFGQAVTPKGDGGYEPPPGDDDAFNAGFNGG